MPHTRPAEVYNAAMAELTEGDGRGLTKIKVSGASPVSSPQRRRAVSTISSGAPLNPLSPRTTSILDHTSSLRAATTSGGQAGVMVMGTASSRGFSSLEPEGQRLVSPTEGGLPHTPPRKATSAPDSQSYQALSRTAVNPWRTGGTTGESLASLSAQPPHGPPPSPPRANGGTMHQAGHHHSPPGRVAAAWVAPGSSPRTASSGGHGHGSIGPNSGAHGHIPIPPLPPSGGSGPVGLMGSGSGGNGPGSGSNTNSLTNSLPASMSVPITGYMAAMGPNGQPLAAAMVAAAVGLPPTISMGLGSGGLGGSFGSGTRQRRDSASSNESHSPGVFDSPSGGPSTAAAGPPLRVATLSRSNATGSPNSPSTPSSLPASLPHTPTCPSGLRPRPPGESPAPPSGLATRSSRKFSHLASPPPAQLAAAVSPPPQQLAAAAAAVAIAQAPSAAVRQLRLNTGGSGLEEVLSRSNSMGGAGTSGLAYSGSPYAGAGNASFGGYGAVGSLPGTPSSASRPGSGRGSSARVGSSRPVAALVDVVRTRDEAKLADVLEQLRAPNGVTAGLNERHHVTQRSPLHEAALANSLPMVAALLAAGADPNLGHPTQGPPLLHCAAWGEVELLRLLLREGADVNAADVEDSTALHFACRGGHVDACRTLMSFGANLSARDAEGKAPFDLAPQELMRMVLGSATAGLADVASPERPPLPPSRPNSGAAGGASSRRGSVSTAGAGSRPTSAAGGPPISPTVPIDMTGGPLRPAPPPTDALASLSSRPRSRRNSGSGVYGSAAGLAAAMLPPTSSAPVSAAPPTSPPPSAGAGNVPSPASAAPGHSPLRHVGGQLDGGNSSTANNTPTPAAGSGAPQSPLQSDTETAPPPSPPMLTLPGGVRRQLSRGAVLGDIIQAFVQEDADIVRKSQPPGAEVDAVAHIAAPEHPPHPHLHGHSHHHPPGLPPGPPGPGAAKLTAKDTTPSFGFTPPAAAAGPGRPAAAAAPGLGVQLSAGTKPGQGAGGKDGSKDAKAKEQPQQPLLPFAMPETSVIRFGMRVHVHSGEDGVEGLSSPPDLAPSGSSGGPFQGGMPSFSAGLPPTAAAAGSPAGTASGTAGGVPPIRFGLPLAEAGSGGGGPSGGFGAAGFTPVPAVGFTPRISNSGGSSTPPRRVSGSGGGGGLGFVSLPRVSGSGAGGTPPRRVSGSGAGSGPLPRLSGSGMAGGPPHRISNTGDDFGGPTPPLMRDSSPVRDRPGGGAGSGTGGVAAGPGPGGGILGGFAANGAPGGGAQGGGAAAGGRLAPTRTSQMAAQALKRISATNVSMDALELRAAALFRQSTELHTGELAWTRGELLGEGAYGKVYAGLNQQTGELMAVKVLQLLSKHGDKKAVIEQLEALEHEMSLYKKLKHKHVVGYIDARFDASTAAFYIFLEYVPGGSIASMLNRFGRFSEDLVRNYTRQLLMGLEYLHGCKIVHRDLKGGNVLVSRDGVVKLADFGASKAYRDHTITDCMKSVRGSVFWMAPEVIRGTGYGRRADIWSLGCTVIEMLTGAHPWPHLDNQWTAMFTIAKTEEGPPRPKGISDEAARFLDKCLQFDPAKRPTAAELLQDPFVARLGGPAAGEDRLQHSF